MCSFGDVLIWHVVHENIDKGVCGGEILVASCNMGIFLLLVSLAIQISARQASRLAGFESNALLV